jgi:hypothetical protein
MKGRLSIKSSMKKILTIMILVHAAALQAGEESPEKNLDILKSLTREIIIESIEDAGIDHDRWIYIQRLDSLSATNWFVEGMLQDTFRELGYDSLAMAHPVAKHTYIDRLALRDPVILRFRTVDLAVEYNAERSFWGNADIQRKVYAELRLSMHEYSSGSLLCSGTRRKVADDTLRRGYIDNIENDNIAFTRGTLPETSIIRRVIEPVFIIGLTGTVVYLFYSLRSN